MLDLGNPPKTLVTNTGFEARVIGVRKYDGPTPYIILIRHPDGIEYPYFSSKQGDCIYNTSLELRPNMMLEAKKKKRTGWINVCNSLRNERITGINIYKSKEEALSAPHEIIDTIEITWEE